jgi:hypothetical protein
MSNRNSLFFAVSKDQRAIFIHRWAGKILHDMTFVGSFSELVNCHKKILLIDPYVASYEIEVTRQLIAQKNYLVFTLPIENFPWPPGLINDIPEVQDFAWVLGGENRHTFSVNLNSWAVIIQSDANIMQAKTYTIDQIFNKRSKPFKFLYLNGRERPHRNYLWQCIDNLNLLECSLNSYLGKTPPKFLPSNYESPLANLDSLPKAGGQTDDYVMFSEHYFKGHLTPNHIVPQQFTDSYFSVVAETTVDDHSVFLTEKTYKPILAGHPFILLANPGSYQYLHSLGFKTFHPFINEDFCFEKDLALRTEMIAHEIERLCNIDLEKFLIQVETICRYNQQHLLDSKNQLFLQGHHGLIEFFNQVISTADRHWSAN